MFVKKYSLLVETIDMKNRVRTHSFPLLKASILKSQDFLKNRFW